MIEDYEPENDEMELLSELQEELHYLSLSINEGTRWIKSELITYLNKIIPDEEPTELRDKMAEIERIMYIDEE